mmetsp:Transcript_25554/g.72976  ORF Transcript_25554/g.72976 Transcript_25554/m.72976 type:complete len:204 (-) Transcript_25554:3-614(-)
MGLPHQSPAMPKSKTHPFVPAMRRYLRCLPSVGILARRSSTTMKMSPLFRHLVPISSALMLGALRTFIFVRARHWSPSSRPMFSMSNRSPAFPKNSSSPSSSFCLFASRRTQMAGDGRLRAVGREGADRDARAGSLCCTPSQQIAARVWKNSRDKSKPQRPNQQSPLDVLQWPCRGRRSEAVLRGSMKAMGIEGLENWPLNPT